VADILVAVKDIRMAYHIKKEATDQLLRKLAKLRRKSMADVIHDALAHELAKEEARTSLWNRLAPIRERIKAAGTAPQERIDWSALKRENDENWGL
jgi:antitoxin VapB